ncbi:S8 family serine peptidase [Methylobacterium frigidaeris]|uniref:Extracellular serine protease n=1 Tax=Methylobacterium frigidaeris TaxID=2038277 RepID=A0AA37M426_9HYPH|nr:S8 family serine peptidase [Methylobacterium frigidaeris]GJD61870.1 Extracellular serine protease [Methylobacterium frigidaeris]
MLRHRAPLLAGLSAIALTAWNDPGRAAEAGPLPAFARIANSDLAAQRPLISPSTIGLSAVDFETPEYKLQYGLPSMNAAAAYARGFTGAGETVAVVDSGIDANHPKFDGRISGLSRNFDIGGSNPGDVRDNLQPEDQGHGTAVAGVVAAARTGQKIHGVAFDAEIMALRATGSNRDTAAALSYAADQGVRILNASYGPGFPQKRLPNGSPNPDYKELEIYDINVGDLYRTSTSLKKAMDGGMLVIAAAGNDGIDQPIIAKNPTGMSLFPFIKPSTARSGDYRLVDGEGREFPIEADDEDSDFSQLSKSLITVVAVDKDATIAPYSNRCGVAANWCMAAVGSMVGTTVPLGTAPNGSDYEFKFGTSFAAPQVAGAAAVLRQAFPFMTAPQLAQTLLTTATDLGDPEIYGWGLLNLGRAVDGPGLFTSTWDVDTHGYYGRFANPIGGPGGLVKRGAGILELAGANQYEGATEVLGGTLVLNGSVTSPVIVEYDGTLRGTGRIASSLASNGIVRPGNSPGTLTVAGPVAFGPDSLLALDIDGTRTGSGAGSHSRLLATGTTATVAAGGALVPILRGITGDASNAYTPALGTRFGVLGAAAGLSGSFAGLAQPTSGLAAGTRFDALYRATGLDLVVTPARYAALQAVGLRQTGNERAVGAALDAARPDAGTRPDALRAPLYDALYASTPASLPGALASLSGQTYGDAVMADLSARRLAGAALDRHLTLGTGLGVSVSAGRGGAGLGPNLDLRAKPGAATAALAVGEGRFWGDAVYGFGTRSRDAAAGGAGFDAGGVILGLDRQVSATTLVGGAFTYLRGEGSSNGAVRDLGRFSNDSYGGTLYGMTRVEAIELRGTVSGGITTGRITRDIAVGSLQRSVSGSLSGPNAGASAFAGTRIAAGIPGTAVIPEAGLSYDYLGRGRVAEAGAAGLSAATRDVNALRSLLGARLASDVVLPGAAPLRFDLRAYWAHELADTTALVQSRLFGTGFSAATSRLARDGAVLGASLSGEIAPGFALQAGYTGEIRARADAHLFSAGLTATW